MQPSYDKFFALLRFSLLGEALPEDFSCEKEEIGQFYALAVKHDIVAILAYALDNNGLLTDDEISGKLRDELMFSAGRVTLQEVFAEEVFETLKEHNIDYIPLKGAVIRNLYPQSYFRTSSDIDVLVRKGDFEKACEILKNDLNLKEKLRTAHDLALIRSDYETVEVHYKLLEEGEDQLVKMPDEEVWRNAEKTEKCAYRLNNEYFSLFHISHLLKHFALGGIGVRFFIDSLIIRKMDVDQNIFAKMLEDNGLTKFYQSSENLVDHWFYGKPADELTLKMERYVIDSGLYGNLKNFAAIKKTKKKGKFRYALSKIFMPYNELKEYYPYLEGRKWLTPFYQIRRTISKIFEGRLKSKVKELKAYDTISENDEREITELFKELEIGG